VAHLAGILRIADGLDYSQEQVVTDVCVKTGETGTIVEITAAGNPRAELKRAAEKADLFESAFHARLRCGMRTAAKPAGKMEAVSA